MPPSMVKAVEEVMVRLDVERGSSAYVDIGSIGEGGNCGGVDSGLTEQGGVGLGNSCSGS